MLFSKINHMIFPDPKDKLQTVKQRCSSGKIKIHQHSSVISLLLGEWLTDAQAWGSPTQQQRGNSLSGENNIPADCLNLSSPRVLYFPSFDPALPLSPFKSQSAHMRRSARRLTNDKLLLGLLSKISAVWLEGVVMGRESGAAEPNKAFWASADKERHTFLRVQAIQKNSFGSEMAVSWRLSSTQVKDSKHGSESLLGPSACRFFVI